MKPPGFWTPERLAIAKGAVASAGRTAKGYHAAALAVGGGVTAEGVQKALRRYGLLPDVPRETPEPASPSVGAETWDVRDGAATVTRTVETPVKTLDELIAACQIDTTQWRVARWRTNTWNGIWQVRADLEPLAVQGATAEQMAAAYETALARCAALPPPPRRARKSEPIHATLSLADHHFGKLGWAREVGESYDLDIASARWREAGAALLADIEPYAPACITIPVGNDLFHVDGYVPQTSSGTPQDTDTRFLKMVEAGLESILWLVSEAYQRAEMVRLVLVPGNHARLTEQLLGITLKHALRPVPNVVVDAEPSPRKYLRHGRVLIGLTHGDQEKHADLPLIMAKERPADWGETQCHEWFLGHFHKNKETRYTAGDSFNGVRVTILPSLCGADAWHHAHGYVGQPHEAVAIVHDLGGRRAVYTFRA